VKKGPHAGSRLALFLDRRIRELQALKTQAEIASAAGFVNPNMITMLKQGTSKLPLDRVPAMAAALDVDPRYLFLLALDQGGNESVRSAVEQVFGAVVSENEARWLAALRDASDGTDPPLTRRNRAAIMEMFGK